MSTDGIQLFDDLSIWLGGRRLVSGAELTLVPATVTVLMGPSGVGKSVLADVAFGLRPTGPADAVKARSRSLGQARDNGSLVFQGDRGVPHFKVRENLELVNSNRDLVNEEIRAFDLPADSTSDQLSGGEARRLAVARAMVAGRDLLWLDEPDAGLDLLRLEELGTRLRRQAEDGLAVLIMSHQTRFVAQVADRVLYLGHNGILREVWRREDAPVSDQGRREALHSRIAGLLAADAKPEEKAQVASGRPGSGPYHWLTELAYSLVALPTLLTNRLGRVSFFRAFRLAVWQGGLFYPIVGAIFAFVFILVFKMGFGFASTGRIIVNYGATILLRLSPPLASILVAARAGSAISAWVGQMTYSRQLDALEVLDAPVRRTITMPAWAALTLAGLTGTLGFGGALLAVFVAYLMSTGEASPALLLGSFELRPVAEALTKTLGFGGLVAAVTVANARRVKSKPDDVAEDLTRGIMFSTIVVMLLELILRAFEYLGY